MVEIELLPNQTLETNCRPATPLDAWWKSGRRLRSTLRFRRQSLSFAFNGTRTDKVTGRKIEYCKARDEKYLAVDFRKLMTEAGRGVTDNPDDAQRI